MIKLYHNYWIIHNQKHNTVDDMSYNFLNKGGYFHGVFGPSSRSHKSWQPSLSTLDIFLVCRGVTGMQSFIRRQKRTWEHHTFEGDFLGYFPSQNQNAVNVCGFLSLFATAKKLYPNALFRKPQSELCIYTVHTLFYTWNCFLSAEVAVPVLLQCHLGKKFCNQVALASIPIFIGSSPFTTGQLSLAELKFWSNLFEQSARAWLGASSGTLPTTSTVSSSLVCGCWGNSLAPNRPTLIHSSSL